MKPSIALALTCAFALCGAANAHARDLNSADPFDARIIAAYHCNKAVMDAGYTEPGVARCKSVYDVTVTFEGSVSQATAAQRSTIAIAKGLSMMTVAAGYAKMDGKMTARACGAIKIIDQSLTGYSRAAPNGLEGLYDLLVETRDVAVPKCRIGGHWPG